MSNLEKFPYHKSVFYRTRDIQVYWTEAVQTALNTRNKSITVEMQLMFSCAPKKRVLFHESNLPKAINVVEKLKILFRPVQPQRCDPEVFAEEYPEEKLLDSKAANKMQPRQLTLDFRKGCWLGEYML